MRFKILAALALTLGAAFFPLLALGDPKPALNEFEIEVQAFAPDAYGRLAGQISIRRANALPFETSYDTSFFATEFPPDQNGFMRVHARLGDGNLYAATIIQSEPGELPGMPMMHAHATLLGAGPPPPSPPAAITDLAATSDEDSQSTLTWSAAAGATSYDVYSSSDGETFALLAEDETSPYVATGLENETEYSFYVMAHGPGGSRRSNTATGTPADVVAPGAPTNFAATPGDTEVVLTWTPPADLDIDYYAVQYAVNEDPPFYAQFSLPAPATTHTFITLTNGVEYLFRIQAVDTSGNGGEFAGPITATPASAEFNPTGMDNIIAWLTARDADSVNESETSAGQTFWLNKVDSAPHALVVSGSANPGYTVGESVDCESSDTLDYSQDLGSLHDIFLTLKVSSGAFGYLFRESSSNYISLTQSSNTIADRISGDTALWNNSTDGMTFPLDEWFVLQIRRDDATHFSLFLNGTLVAQKFANVSPPANQIATTLVNSLSGVSLGDIVVFSANVPSEDQATLTADLKTRYGIE